MAQDYSHCSLRKQMPFRESAITDTGTGGFTVASGNLALVKNVSPNSLDIVNDTCAEMYLRIVVRADGPQVIGAVAAPDSGPRDGGL